MPRGSYHVVSPWRMPWPREGTPRSRRVKRLTIHFNPMIWEVGPPPLVEMAPLIRWEQPIDIHDNAHGVIDEISTMWIPQRTIRETDRGLSHPDFARSGAGHEAASEVEEEAWNLWQS